MSQAAKPWRERTSFIERAAMVLYFCQRVEREKRIMQNIQSAISQSPPKARMTVNLLVEKGLLTEEEREDGRKVYTPTKSGEEIKKGQLPLIFKLHSENWSRKLPSPNMSEILRHEYDKWISLARKGSKDE